MSVTPPIVPGGTAPSHAAESPSSASSPDAPSRASSRTLDVKGLALPIVVLLAVVFALQWAQKFFVPLLLGIIIAYTLNPLVIGLERVNIPRMVGTTLVMLALICIGGSATISLGEPVSRILEQVPEAAGKLSATLKEMAGQPNAMQKMQAAAREIELITNQAAETPTSTKKPAPQIVLQQSSFKLTDVLWAGSLGILGVIGETAMFLLLIFFLLLSGDTFKRKLVRMSGPSLANKKITVHMLDEINSSIQNYMFTLLVTNVLLGLLTWLTFSLIGLENAGAWGAAAGVLHVMPYIGPALLAGASGMAAFLQFNSFLMALVVSGASLVIASLIGIFIVTWMTGRTAKMNSVAMFIGLLFWGWLWGAWGVLLAIPIMVMMKVVSEHIEELHPVAALLGEETDQDDGRPHVERTVHE